MTTNPVLKRRVRCWLVLTCDKFTHQRFLFPGTPLSWSPTRPRSIFSLASFWLQKTKERSGAPFIFWARIGSRTPDHGRIRENANYPWRVPLTLIASDAKVFDTLMPVGLCSLTRLRWSATPSAMFRCGLAPPQCGCNCVSWGFSRCTKAQGDARKR